MGDLGLLLRSLPYLRPGQLPQRGWRLSAETALLSLGGIRLAGRPPSRLLPGRDAERSSPRLAMWALRPDDASEVASNAARGAFRFLGIEAENGDRLRWSDPDVPRLWRFHLNGFEWAWAFAADEPGRWGPRLATFVEDWHRANPPRRGDAWHPFVVAERLINLLRTRDLWLPHVATPDSIERSLWRQARFVKAAVERDVGGNHVIREATALVMAGSAFQSARMRDGALSLLGRALGRQILADGGHEERSPSYHLEVMTDLADVRAVLPAEHPFRSRLQATLGSMADFAASMCHPDGQLAMFNDCVPWPVPPDEYLRALGLDPRPGPHFPQSGYHVLGDGPDRLFFDTGPPSPRDLPPHGHCDLLSFELSIEGVRMVVNSGTGDYARGPWRDYWRSTRAHNTVEVDGTEQSEVWHSFRMADRASPTGVRVMPGPNGDAVVGGHDGYRRLRPPVLHRRMVTRCGRAWVVADLLEGSGHHSIRSFLHLHPDVAVTEANGGWLVERKGVRLRVAPFGDVSVSVAAATSDPIENWVAPDLGRRVPGKSLVAAGCVGAPALFGWVLAPGTGPLQTAIDATTAPAVQVGDDDREARIDLAPLVKAGGRPA